MSTVKGDGIDDAVESVGSADDSTKQSGANWNDPAVPIGDAPPLPRWPVVAAGLVWLLWIGFLVVIMLSRTDGSAS